MSFWNRLGLAMFLFFVVAGRDFPIPSNKQGVEFTFLCIAFFLTAFPNKDDRRMDG